MNSEWSPFLVKLREHWKCSCSLFQVRSRHLLTAWEAFQHTGSCKWFGVVAYLFPSKLFSGLPPLLCDMPLKKTLKCTLRAHNMPQSQQFGRHYFNYPARMLFCEWLCVPKRQPSHKQPKIITATTDIQDKWMLALKMITIIASALKNNWVSPK